MAPPKHNRLSCEEIEELVPELLYGELDDEREAEVRARLPECELADKVAGYERLRALLHELPDEEPPPAITAQLMHAAAKQVEGKRVQADAPGWWERLRGWFGPMGLHPALGAAATLVLVAGAASLLYLRGADRALGPDVASRATPPTAGTARAPVAATAAPRSSAVDEAPQQGAPRDFAADPDDGRAEVTAGLLGNVAGDAPAADAPTTPDALAGRAGERKADEGRARPKASDRANAAKGGKLDVASGGGGLLDGLADEGGVGSGYGGDKAARSRGAAAEPQEQAPALEEAEAEDAPEPERAQQQEAKPSAPPPPPKSSNTSKSKKKAPSSSTLKKLHAEAVQAAEAGDCARVRSLGGRIESLDGAYYRDVFRRDSTIRSCDAPRK